MSLSKTSAGESALRARVFVPLIATLVLLGLGLALPVSALALRASGAAGWQAQNASSASSQAGLNDVTFVDASHGWAVGRSIPAPGDWAPLILATGDGGATWHAQDASSAGSNAALISVNFVDVNHGWALGNNPGSDNSPILATTDGGVIWNAVNTGDAGSNARLSSISFVDAEHGWAVGSSYDDVSGTLSPLILATSDGGGTWHAQNAGSAGSGGAQLSSITFADADHGWAVGQSSSASGAQSVIILATTNGGVIWKAENAGSAGSNAGLSDVAFSDATHGWAVGSSYNPSQSGDSAFLILATSDGGATWNVQSADSAGQFPGRFSRLGSVSFVDAVHGWAVGSSEDAPSDFIVGTLVILATTDGGVTWNAQNASSGGRAGYLGSVSFVDANHGWVAGGNFYPATNTHSPVILATSNGGQPTPKLTPTLTLKLSGLRSGAMRLGRSVMATGKVTPTSLAGSKVKLTVQRKRSARWVTLKSVARTIGSSGAYSWKYKPARRGAYRMRATIAKTAAHTAATTTWRSFKVK